MTKTTSPTLGVRRLMSVAMSLFVAAALHPTGAVAQTDDPHAYFLELERSLMQAVADRDSATAAAYLHDAFQLVSSESSGEVIGKWRYLRGIGPTGILEVDSFRFHDLEARELAEGVVQVTTRLDWKSEYRGLRWDADFIMTDLWTDEDGRWQLMHRHSSYPRDRVRVTGRDIPVAASPEDPAPACDGPRFRDFDYWIGTWAVYNTEGERIGTNTISAVAGACALVERWQPVRGPTGISLNHYDPARQRWEQLWVGAGGLTLRLAGGMEGGGMVLTGTEPRTTPRGEVIDRIHWVPEEGGVRQIWEVSPDEGTTWQRAFEGLYRPVGS